LNPADTQLSLRITNTVDNRRFVKFLELSEVGRVMADGTDEDGARAAKMDE
jgi:hypothetical protein